MIKINILCLLMCLMMTNLMVGQIQNIFSPVDIESNNLHGHVKSMVESYSNLKYVGEKLTKVASLPPFPPLEKVKFDRNGHTIEKLVYDFEKRQLVKDLSKKIINYKDQSITYFYEGKEYAFEKFNQNGLLILGEYNSYLGVPHRKIQNEFDDNNRLVFSKDTFFQDSTQSNSLKKEYESSPSGGVIMKVTFFNHIMEITSNTEINLSNSGNEIKRSMTSPENDNCKIWEMDYNEDRINSQLEYVVQNNDTTIIVEKNYYYDREFRLIQETSVRNNGVMEINFFEYNKKGWLSREIEVIVVDCQKSAKSYTEYEYDRKGNWTSALHYNQKNTPYSLVERKIKYYLFRKNKK